MEGMPSLPGPPDKISFSGIDRLLKSVFQPRVEKRARRSSSSSPKSGVDVTVGHGVSPGAGMDDDVETEGWEPAAARWARAVGVTGGARPRGGGKGENG